MLVCACISISSKVSVLIHVSITDGWIVVVYCVKDTVCRLLEVVLDCLVVLDFLSIQTLQIRVIRFLMSQSHLSIFLIINCYYVCLYVICPHHISLEVLPYSNTLQVNGFSTILPHTFLMIWSHWWFPYRFFFNNKFNKKI